MMWLDQFRQDFRFGVRSLLRTPSWTAILLLTFAAGIALTTAIFSVVYSVVLQRLPYRDPDRVVALWLSSATLPRFNVSPGFWRDWRAQATSFDDIALTRPVANFNLTGHGPAERLQGARTSSNLADVLGVRPLHGRWFTEEETARGAKVAVLSYGLWERRFAKDTTLIGKMIQLNGGPFEVIGVMAPSYAYPSRDFELWTPLFIPEATYRSGVDNSYRSVARLKPGVPIDRARAELEAITARLSEKYPAVLSSVGQTTALVMPLVESEIREVKSSLYVLMAASACLLLVGCLNLALLLVGRASGRQKEIAVRSALGASALRLARQTVAEALPLACAGAAAGLIGSYWMLGLLQQWLPATMPRAEAIALHPPVVVFAIVVSFVVVIAAALWPARQAVHAAFQSQLQGASRGVTRAAASQGAMVVAQVAITMVVLFAAALFARSADALFRVDLGFEPEQVLSMHLAVTREKYPEDAQISEYYRRLEERITSIPGVSAAGFVNRLPLSGTSQINPVVFADRPALGSVAVDTRSATPGYFAAMRIPLRAGRYFTDADGENSPPVGLIDDVLARRVFGDENPVGRQFRFGLEDVMEGPWVEIVGVVGHIKHDSPDTDLRSQVYFPQAQRTQDRAALVVKTSGDPRAFLAPVVAQIQEENPDQPVYDVRTLDEWRDRTLHPQRLLSGLVALFGVSALILASLGLYGVVSYATSLRMREFAVRAALGAERSDLRQLVFRYAGTLGLTGLAIGFGLVFPTGRAIGNLLFQVSATDVLALAVPAVILLVVCLAAAAIPARRATRPDLAAMLRAE